MMSKIERFHNGTNQGFRKGDVLQYTYSGSNAVILLMLTEDSTGVILNVHQDRGGCTDEIGDVWGITEMRDGGDFQLFNGKLAFDILA